MRLGVIVATVVGGAPPVVIALWPEPQTEPRHLCDHDARGLSHPFMAGGALGAPPQGN